MNINHIRQLWALESNNISYISNSLHPFYQSVSSASVALFHVISGGRIVCLSSRISLGIYPYWENLRRHEIFQFMAQLSTDQFTKLLTPSHKMSRIVRCSSKPLVDTCISSARNCGCVAGVLWMQLDVTAPRLNMACLDTCVISKVFHLTNKLCNTILNQGHPCHVLTQAGIETFLSCNTCQYHKIKTGVLMPQMTDWSVEVLVTPALSICNGCCWASFSWWSSQTVSEGDYSLVCSVQYHVFYLTVPFCFTLLFIVLVFSNKTLGTFY